MSLQTPEVLFDKPNDGFTDCDVAIEMIEKHLDGLKEAPNASHENEYKLTIPAKLTLDDLLRCSEELRGARWLVPEAPDFVRSYCRKVTALWVGFFAGSAVLIAVLAVSGAQAWWELYTGQLVYALMMAISAVEFFVRKTWFRYYFHMGPFDRLWSTLFPAENTPQGRRSEAYIRLFKPNR